MFPGFPREKREWTSVSLNDEEIGKTKAFRFFEETGEVSETLIGRVGFFRSNPFTGKKTADKTASFAKQVMFYISAKMDRTQKKIMKNSKTCFFSSLARRFSHTLSIYFFELDVVLVLKVTLHPLVIYESARESAFFRRGEIFDRENVRYPGIFNLFGVKMEI